jgi:hypothetical protein
VEEMHMAQYISFATKPEKEYKFLTIRNSDALYYKIVDALPGTSFNDYGKYQEITTEDLKHLLKNAEIESYELERQILISLIIKGETNDLERYQEIDWMFSDKKQLEQSIGALKMLIDIAEDNNGKIYFIM